MSDIAELMGRDPLSLTNPEIEEIIAYQRSCRHRFNQGDLRAGRPTTAKPKTIEGLDTTGLVVDL